MKTEKDCRAAVLLFCFLLAVFARCYAVALFEIGHKVGKILKAALVADLADRKRGVLQQLLGERKMSIHKPAMESAVPPSSIKNILYGKSKNPGIVTLKMLCDGLGITLVEFFDTKEFRDLEQEIQ